MKKFTFMCCFMIAAAFVQGQIIHVPEDYNSIQEAINAADPGDTILVSEGTYYEQLDFLGKKPLMVASLYLADGNYFHITNTKLDGSQIPNQDNGSIVSFISGEDTTSVLCGFTIQNGNKGTAITGLDGEPTRVGGAIHISSSGAKIIHNRIINNHLIKGAVPGSPWTLIGAGIYTDWVEEHHWIILDHNSFENNTVESDTWAAGSGAACILCNAVVTDNTFLNNSVVATSTAYSYGGALTFAVLPPGNLQVSSTITGNTFSNNEVSSETGFARGGAILSDLVSGTFSNNTFENNSASGNNGEGGGIYLSNPKSNSLVSNNVFNGNNSNYGGGGLSVVYQVGSFPNTIRLMVENNIFTNNDAPKGGGLDVFDKAILLQNNVFSGNSASLGGALNLKQELLPVDHMAVLMNNSFFHNMATTAGGAIHNYKGNPLVINSILWSDSSSVGFGFEIHLSESTDTIEIAYCDLDFSLINGNALDGGGNINEYPQFNDPELLTILGISPCRDAGTAAFTCQCGESYNAPAYDIDNIIRPWPENGLFDIGAHEYRSILPGNIIHVPADFPTIQAGINAANPGDTVLVADSVYYEQINFLGKKPLMVASEFIIDGDESHIANTIIDGSMITDTINGSVVTFNSGEDTTSILYGFTIRNGNVGTLCAQDSIGGELNARAGGGIFMYNSGAKIIHNHITENHLVDSGFPGNPIVVTGGGLYHGPYTQAEHWVVLDHNSIDLNSTHSGSAASMGGGVIVQSSTMITNNNISGNIATSQAGAFSWGGGLVGTNNPSLPSQVKFIVKNNNISNNQLHSTGVAAEAAGAVFEHAKCIISQNIVEYNMVDAINGFTAGMVVMRPQNGTLVSGNFFRENSTTIWQGGLLVYSDYTSIYQDTATVLVENNYFIGNEATHGGGMLVENTPAILQNNVFSGNHASSRAGALNIYNSLLPVEHMVKIINNSFDNNKAGFAGGAIYSYGDNPLVINSIFWHDSSSAGSGFEIHLAGSLDKVEIANSNIDTNLINRNVIDGGGIINEDPLFDNLDSLTLSLTSPCIDAGTDIYTCECGEIHISPAYDIIGVPRPQSGAFEMGAYEVFFVGTPEVLSPQSSVVSYPNPFASYTTFEYELEQSAIVNLSVYNHIGQQVAVLVNGEQLAGKHQLRWNAEGMPSGIYYYRLTTNDYRLTTGKLVLVR